MHDNLETFKGIHIKLKKDTHTNLRILLFKKRLSMQEIFEEFARLLHAEDRAALRMLENLIAKKAKERLNKVEKTKMSELDQETIYNLLEDQSPLANRDNPEEDE